MRTRDEEWPWQDTKRIFMTDKEFSRVYGPNIMEAMCVGNWRKITAAEKQDILEDLKLGPQDDDCKCDRLALCMTCHKPIRKV